MSVIDGPTVGDRIVYIDKQDTILSFSLGPVGQPREEYVFVRGFAGRGATAQAMDLLLHEHDVLALQELLKTFLAERSEKKLAPATAHDYIGFMKEDR